MKASGATYDTHNSRSKGSICCENEGKRSARNKQRVLEKIELRLIARTHQNPGASLRDVYSSLLAEKSASFLYKKVKQLGETKFLRLKPGRGKSYKVYVTDKGRKYLKRVGPIEGTGDWPGGRKWPFEAVRCRYVTALGEVEASQ